MATVISLIDNARSIVNSCISSDNISIACNSLARCCEVRAQLKYQELIVCQLQELLFTADFLRKQDGGRSESVPEPFTG